MDRQTTSQSHRERLLKRSQVVTAIRGFFDAQGFVEVDTPVAISAPAPEPYLEAARVNLRTCDSVEKRFLQPSPELPMKRLLAHGFERIYQIAVVFRDGELTARHRPEFRLLEWYRRSQDWQTLLDDCEGLLRTSATAAGVGLQFSYAGRPVDLSGPFRRVSVEEAFVEYAGFSILDCLDRESLARQVDRLGLSRAEDDSWDDLFHRIFLSRIECALLDDARPLFLTHYPAPLAALARLDPCDPRRSERFELFAGTLELANGFGELTDAQEQRRRFTRDAAVRRTLDMNEYPIDERFIEALESIPAAAGIALGLERLLMLLLDAADIDDVAFIPWRHT